MMVGKKYHTVLIMPSTPGRRIIRFSLPSFCWPIFYGVVGAMVFWAGVGTWSFYNHHQITQRSQWLEKENQLAKTQLEDEKQKVKFLNQRLNKIREKSVFIQNFLGLKPQGKAKGNIGQGGVEVSPQAFSHPSNAASEVNIEPVGLIQSAQPLNLSHQDINQLDKDLHQLIITLQERQEKMECTPSISPVDPQKSWISSAYGRRISQFTGKKQFHPGIDIAGWKGTPIMAPAKGKVTSVRKWGSMGLMVTIKHDSTYQTVYGHLLKAAVKRGQRVKRGEVIGYMGNSGRSTGYHLHYEVRKNGKRINPFFHMMDWDKNRTLMASSEG
jgi:murein DD-endopeptidase MepM/ murein hydrolase activator NlpD